MINLNKANGLTKESSLYLQQHAHNTVNWHPWGGDALNLAKKENKPIFLSIGYSSCHWCHVMREESFEDDKVGQLLNEYFISIKVDREERPDLDHIYMNFSQAMTGRGGWPLNVFLTPDEKPFYAMTYLPKESQGEHMGFKELLAKVHGLWIQDEDRVRKSASYTVEAVKGVLNEKTSEAKGVDLRESAFQGLKQVYDETYGGFHSGQKFPLPQHLLFLLRYYAGMKDKTALAMVENTLMAMYQGGIFDHLGYGFSRYTVDEDWQIPHFEKMLYDNALLLRVYAEAYQVTKNPLYRDISEKIIDYIHNDMTSNHGLFYSSQDADSDGEEGKFYVFSYEEIINVLGDKDGAEFAQYFGASRPGNFEGKNVLHLTKESFLNYPTNIDLLKEKMLDYRNRRVHPSTDKKILTSWNGLMIGSLAYAGKVFNEDKYVDRAKKALDNILELHYKNHELYASSYEGVLGPKAFLNSFSYLLYGVFSLQEATLDGKYVRLAKELEKEMEVRFWDEEGFGYYLRSKSETKLVMEIKDFSDGALPSANAMAAFSLAKLWSITGNRAYENKLKKMIDGLRGKMEEQPLGNTGLLLSYEAAEKGPKEVVLTGYREDKAIKGMIMQLNDLYLPEYTVTLHDPKRRDNEQDLYELWREVSDEMPTAYVCRDYACLDGVLDSAALKEILLDS